MSDVRQMWIASLSKLVQPAEPTGAAKAMAAYLPMLGEFPMQAFNAKSLQFVAERCKRLPSYAELYTPLAEWWRDNRPSPPALNAPEQRQEPREAPSPEALEQVRKMVGAFCASFGTPSPERRKAAPKHLSDGALIDTYEALARAGNTAAAVRLQGLKAKMGSFT